MPSRLEAQEKRGGIVNGLFPRKEREKKKKERERFSDSERGDEKKRGAFSRSLRKKKKGAEGNRGPASSEKRCDLAHVRRGEEKRNAIYMNKRGKKKERSSTRRGKKCHVVVSLRGRRK